MSGKDQSVISKEALMSTKPGKQIMKQALFKKKGYKLFNHYKEETEKEFPNFKFYLVLSEPLPEDNWVNKIDANDTKGDGFTGFVHQAVIDEYLSKHESPEDIELYFCGPPLMNKAVQKMGEDFGMPDENIRFDDFGG